jgi:predicted transport protein
MTNTTHLYNIGETTKKIQKKTDIVEKDIQTIIEKDLETYLGIRFIDTEYSTGKVHGGRIDTIGIDETNNPVIIEYKKSIDSGAAMQGLYYLAWLLDHKLEFKFRVLEKFGSEVSQNINWSQPRVICIANDFKKYVIGAVDHMGPNIELMQYQLYENNILVITDVYTKNQQKNVPLQTKNNSLNISTDARTRLNNCDNNIKNIFESLKTFLLDLDESVKMIEMKSYMAFKTKRNFALVTFHPKKEYIQIGAFIDPNSIELEEGFTHDRSDVVSNHDGSVLITIKTFDDLEKTKPLLAQSYNNA